MKYAPLALRRRRLVLRADLALSNAGIFVRSY